jgi:hypothetical protein
MRRAVETHPAVLEWARDDAALDAIRDDPRYPKPASGA